MRLILSTLVLAIVVGYLVGGRLSNFAGLRVRWPFVAVIGLALQLVPVPGTWLPLVLLFVSFVLLFVFAAVNARAGVPGFVLILVGIALNFTVIALNHGMPVTRQALVASHQTDTLHALVHGGGAKHHLAGSDDRLLALGDVIAIEPIRQAVSLGDLFTYGGVAWLIVAGMLGGTGPRLRRSSRASRRMDVTGNEEPTRVG